MKKLKYIDLFSGAGGTSLGFDTKGFRNVFSIDIDPDCCETYKLNFPEHHLIRKNIGDLSEKEISKLTGGKEMDVVIGGPPCQGFSVAGKILMSDRLGRAVREKIYECRLDSRFLNPERLSYLEYHRKYVFS